MFAPITTSLLAIVLATASAAEGASGTKSDLSKTEQIFAELMALPGKERLQKLVEGAKKESVLVWYAPDREELTNLRVDFFKELQPGVIQKFQTPRILPDIMINRLLTEERAGKHQADVVWLQFHQVSALERDGMLARYVALEDAALPDGLKVAGQWRSLGNRLFHITTRSSWRRAKRRKAGRTFSIQNGGANSSWMRLLTTGLSECWTTWEKRRAWSS
jgi:hypothetical protein